MPLLYQPGVRIVFGHVGHAAAPPPTYCSAATVALQTAVSRLGKDWKRVAPMFVVAPAAGSGRVVVGLAMGRAPVIFDAAQMIEPKSVVAREHYVVPSGFQRIPDVDKYGNTQADQGILDGLASGAGDPALASLGLELEASSEGPAYYLLSDDGRAGAMVYGQVFWKPGKHYEGGGVRTFAHDHGGGEGVRVVGVPYVEVGPDAPLARIDSSPGSRQAHGNAAMAATRTLLDSPVAWSWYLVCDEAPGPLTRAEPSVAGAPAMQPRAAKTSAPPLSDGFVVRPLAAAVAALEALGAGAVAPQALDLAEIASAFSRDDLSSAPEHAPQAALYSLRVTPDATTLADPAAFLRSRLVPHDALGTWNANAQGKWTCGADWIVMDLELVSEQDDEGLDTRVSAILALFAVEGGWASAVWPGHRHEELATLLGFDPWARSAWHECSLWFGEG
jgi:hypothetical protein